MYVQCVFLWVISLYFGFYDCVFVGVCRCVFVCWPCSLLLPLIFYAPSLWSFPRPPRPGGTPETPRRTSAAPPQPSNPALQAQIKQGNYKRKGTCSTHPQGLLGRVGGRRGGSLIIQPTGNKTHREFELKKKKKMMAGRSCCCVLSQQVLKGFFCCFWHRCTTQFNPNLYSPGGCRILCLVSQWHFDSHSLWQTSVWFCHKFRDLFSKN